MFRATVPRKNKKKISSAWIAQLCRRDMASKSRAELVKILETASDISVEACDIILKACGGSAIMGHGSILWALMDTEGTPATISGFKLFVYLQYYFCAQVFTKNKLAIARPLTDTELAYLVAAAAFGAIPIPP